MERMNKIHDWAITGIVISDEKDIWISINDFYNDTGKGKLILKDVKYCRFDNFKLGNIILDFTIFDSNDINKIDKDLCYVLDISKDETEKEWVRKIINDLSSSNLVLAVLTESYGVCGAVICKEIVFDLKAKCQQNSEVSTN